MFAVDIHTASFYARFSGLKDWTRSKGDRIVDRTSIARQPQDLICDALAEMLPSTVEEIAEATGLDAVTTSACLDRLAARYQVMFNPLTKRFSLPRNLCASGLAA
jgi:hypothetical protein